MKKTIKTVYLEKAILVGVITSANKLEFESILAELEQLAKTAGAIVSDIVIQKRDIPDITYYIGRGKVDEIRDIVGENEADVVIFDNELSPAQIRNLENAIKVKVIDRTELILDIFDPCAFSAGEVTGGTGAVGIYPSAPKADVDASFPD